MTEAPRYTCPLRLVHIVPLVIISMVSSAFADTGTPSPRSNALGADYEAVSPATVEATPREAQREPTGSLSLPDALVASLLQNPELAIFAWEIRARDAEALQAGVLPNPELTVEAENFAGGGGFSGYDGAETTLMLGQLIELGGKRTKRRTVAELERNLATWDYEIQRLDVLTAVVQDFVSVLEAQRRLSLAEDLRELSDESLRAVSKRVHAGAASSVEQTRAQVNLSSAEVAKRRARAELAAARARLASRWGAQSARFESAVGDLDSIYAPPTSQSIGQKLQESPDVERWSAELSRREAVVALEESQRIPDVTIGGGVRRFEENGDSALLFGVTIPFPVFDRNQGARRAARDRHSQARSEKRAVATRVFRELEASTQTLHASYDAVTALRERVIPQAEAAYSGVQTGYLQGLFRYVDVLDAQRTLFELREAELTELGRFHRAAAAVERLTGVPLGDHSIGRDSRNEK